MVIHKKVDSKTIDEMLMQAHHSPRLRVHREIHDRGADSPIQWFLNVIVPGSFCSPHFHPEQGKWEWFQILRGKAVILLFDETGTVTDRVELSPDTVQGIEIPAQAWHTIAALEPSALMELKSGPYNPMSDKRFASWAPRENEPGADRCERWYQTAQIGDRFDRGDA